MLEDPEYEGDDEGTEKNIVREVGAGESYTDIRVGKHRENWLLMG